MKACFSFFALVVCLTQASLKPSKFKLGVDKPLTARACGSSEFRGNQDAWDKEAPEGCPASWASLIRMGSEQPKVLQGCGDWTGLWKAGARLRRDSRRDALTLVSADAMRTKKVTAANYAMAYLESYSQTLFFGFDTYQHSVDELNFLYFWFLQADLDVSSVGADTQVAATVAFTNEDLMLVYDKEFARVSVEWYDAEESKWQVASQYSAAQPCDGRSAHGCVVFSRSKMCTMWDSPVYFSNGKVDVAKVYGGEAPDFHTFIFEAPERHAIAGKFATPVEDNPFAAQTPLYYPPLVAVTLLTLPLLLLLSRRRRKRKAEANALPAYGSVQKAD